MALRDDILSNESYFIVEIKSLKRIFEKAKEPGVPVLCFIDEILRGTNTVERVAASSKLLEALSGENAMCLPVKEREGGFPQCNPPACNGRF